MPQLVVGVSCPFCDWREAVDRDTVRRQADLLSSYYADPLTVTALRSDVERAVRSATTAVAQNVWYEHRPVISKSE